jgi:hypothetical protein
MAIPEGMMKSIQQGQRKRFRQGFAVYQTVLAV